MFIYFMIILQSIRTKSYLRGAPVSRYFARSFFHLQTQHLGISFFPAVMVYWLEQLHVDQEELDSFSAQTKCIFMSLGKTR